MPDPSAGRIVWDGSDPSGAADLPLALALAGWGQAPDPAYAAAIVRSLAAVVLAHRARPPTDAGQTNRPATDAGRLVAWRTVARSARVRELRWDPTVRLLRDRSRPRVEHPGADQPVGASSGQPEVTVLLAELLRARVDHAARAPLVRATSALSLTRRALDRGEQPPAIAVELDGATEAVHVALDHMDAVLRSLGRPSEREVDEVPPVLAACSGADPSGGQAGGQPGGQPGGQSADQPRGRSGGRSRGQPRSRLEGGPGGVPGSPTGGVPGSPHGHPPGGDATPEPWLSIVLDGAAVVPASARALRGALADHLGVAAVVRTAAGERTADAVRSAAGELTADAARTAAGELTADAVRSAAGERTADAVRSAAGVRTANAARTAAQELSSVRTGRHAVSDVDGWLTDAVRSVALEPALLVLRAVQEAVADGARLVAGPAVGAPRLTIVDAAGVTIDPALAPWCTVSAPDRPTPR